MSCFMKILCTIIKQWTNSNSQQLPKINNLNHPLDPTDFVSVCESEQVPSSFYPNSPLLWKYRLYEFTDFH